MASGSKVPFRLVLGCFYHLAGKSRNEKGRPAAAPSSIVQWVEESCSPSTCFAGRRRCPVLVAVAFAFGDWLPKALEGNSLGLACQVDLCSQAWTAARCAEAVRSFRLLRQGCIG